MSGCPSKWNNQILFGMRVLFSHQSQFILLEILCPKGTDITDPIRVKHPERRTSLVGHHLFCVAAFAISARARLRTGQRSHTGYQFLKNIYPFNRDVEALFYPRAVSEKLRTSHVFLILRLQSGGMCRLTTRQ